MTEVLCSCSAKKLNDGTCNHNRKCGILSVNGENVGKVRIAGLTPDHRRLRQALVLHRAEYRRVLHPLKSDSIAFACTNLDLADWLRLDGPCCGGSVHAFLE